MNKIAYVFLNNPQYHQEENFIKALIAKYSGDVYAVDGGANITFNFGLTPKLIIGDLDSISLDALSYYQDNTSRQTDFLTFPSEKDQNDTELLLDYLVGLGYSKIIMFGMIGGRYDHSLFNMFLLQHYKQIIALDSSNCCLLLPKINELNFKSSQTISFFPLTAKVTELTLQGFKYSTQNLTITQGMTLTLSNETQNSQCKISYSEGKLLGCFNFNIFKDIELFNQLLELK